MIKFSEKSDKIFCSPEKNSRKKRELVEMFSLLYKKYPVNFAEKEAGRVKKARFDERLDGVIAEASKRLSERMKRAYLHGFLNDYLKSIGFCGNKAEIVSYDNFQEVQQIILKKFTENIARARRKGYLKDYLQRVNMMDLLLYKRHIRTVHLRGIRGGNKDAAKKNPNAPVLRILKNDG